MYQDDELDELEEDKLDDMDRGELKEFIRIIDLSIHVTKDMSDDDIRKIIRAKQAEIAEVQFNADLKKLFLRKLFWRDNLFDRIILWMEWVGVGICIIGIIVCIIMGNISK